MPEPEIGGETAPDRAELPPIRPPSEPVSREDGGTPSPPPQVQRIRRLDSLRGVRREMAAIYAECRRGTLPIQSGCRLVFMLASIGKLIQQADLEARIEELERLAGTP